MNSGKREQIQGCEDRYFSHAGESATINGFSALGGLRFFDGDLRHPQLARKQFVFRNAAAWTRRVSRNCLRLQVVYDVMVLGIGFESSPGR